MVNIPIGISGSFNPPSAGQIFKSYEESKHFFFLYAPRVGFSVRKGTTKVVDGKLVVRHFVCCKEGFSKGIVSKMR